MVFADKLIMLRKKQGWSQEELAERMDVSRQAVSKWESAQALPDIDKIVTLSALFSVTTDYLLKDTEWEEAEDPEAHPTARTLTLAEADKYIAWRRIASLLIALGTFLCIISVIPLLFLPMTSVHTALGISNDVACMIALVALFVTVAAGVCIFVVTGIKNGEYSYLDGEFVLQGDTRSALDRRLLTSRTSYLLLNVIAVAICILSPLLIVIPALLSADELLTFTLPGAVLAIAVAVFLFIVGGVRHSCLMRLLKRGEYSDCNKENVRVKEMIDSVYWSVVLAIYLGWSFISGAWKISWVVWPIAGVLSVAVYAVLGAIKKERDE